MEGFVSHAQNFEDVRLWRAFADVAQGRYLDIGTQDPVRDSVSLAFYERGWRGVHVEPTPAYAAATRAARPDETVIEAAVSNRSGPIEFFEIPQTGISTGIASIAQRHAEAGYAPRLITVPTVTLADLFTLMGDGPIHWLKIDVEGMEAEVLESWGEHPSRPAALVIEATAPNTQLPTHEAWYELVLSRGYRDVLFDGLSRFFIHESQAERGTALALSPNVFDGFQITASHFATGALAAEHEAEVTAARAAGELLGQVSARAEAAEAKLAAAEAHHLALTERLAERERALDQAQAVAAERHGELKASGLAHTEALARADRALLAAQDQAAQLMGQLAGTSQRLGEATAEREHTEGRAALLAGQLAEISGRLADVTEQREHAAGRAVLLETELAEARAANARQQACLAEAAALLRSAPAPISGWPHRLALLLGPLAGRRSRDAVQNHAAGVRAWLRLAEGQMASKNIECLVDNNTDIVNRDDVLANTDICDPEGPITAVPRLLAPHDAEFIRTAYEAVLGRAPDPEGGAYYLARLRAGTHKLEILKQLRRSPEGRNFIPGVAGLDRAIKRHRRANLPLVGWIIRSVNGAEGNGATHRQLRILANDLGRLRTEQQSILSAVARLDDLPAQIAARIPVSQVLPPLAPPASEPAPPSLDAGAMPLDLASQERTLLTKLRLFSRSRGAAA